MKKEPGLLIAAAAFSVVAVTPWDLWFPDLVVLDPRLRPVAAVFGCFWVFVRFRACHNSRKRWRSWRLPLTWSVEAHDLPFESTRHWLPKDVARLLQRLLSAETVRRRWVGLGDWLSQAVCYHLVHPWALPFRRQLRGWLYPDTGILLGRAFRWSPEHTQELETHLQSGQPLPVGLDMRGGYPALHAVGKKEELPLVLPWSELVGHVLIGGTTRSGKTRLLEVILSEAIRGPGTVIVIDPKGDAELLIRAATEAYRSGREFAFFSPASPKCSSSFNPFSMCTNTTELAARVQALMPGGGGMSKGDPFFTEYPLAVVEKIGAAQNAVGERWTIQGLNAATTLVPPFESLLARYLARQVGKREDRDLPDLDTLIAEYRLRQPDERDLLADALIDDHEKPRDHFVQVTANLVPAFRGVTGGDMDRLLSSSEPDLTWDGVVEERKVVYFAMSSLMFGEAANRIGRVILQDLIGFLGRRYAFDDPARMTPLTILIDEFSNVAYPGFIDALNKGGGAKANIMLAMQSLADPEAAMGKDGTQRVLDNLNTRIWFRLTDDATAKLAVEGLGMTSVSREDISHSLSFGGSSGTSGGSRGGLQYVDRSLVRPEWVTGLPRGEAFVRTRGENWKLRVPLLEPVGKKEVREVAAAYGLEGAIAELKEKTEKARQEPVKAASPEGQDQTSEAAFGKDDLASAQVDKETPGDEGSAEMQETGDGGSDTANEGSDGKEGSEVGDGNGTEAEGSHEAEMAAAMELSEAVTKG